MISSNNSLTNKFGYHLSNKSQYMFFKADVFKRVKFELKGELTMIERYKIVHLLPFLNFPSFESNYGTCILKRFQMKKSLLPKNPNSLLYLRSCKNLEVINFSRALLNYDLAKFSRNSFKRISRSCKEVILKMTNFESLTVENCLEIQTRMVKYLANIRSLIYINIQFSDLNEDLCNAFSIVMKLQNKLKYLTLDLSNCQVTQDFYGLLFDSISLKTSLEGLKLTSGSLRNEKDVILFSKLSLLKNLQVLSISLFELNSESAEELGKFFDKLESLKKLSFYGRVVGSNDNFVKAFNKDLNLNLETFYLSSVGVMELPEFKSSVNLKSLRYRLSYGINIPTNFGSLNKLITHDLENLELRIAYSIFPLDRFSPFLNSFSMLKAIKDLTFDFEYSTPPKQFYILLFEQLISNKITSLINISFNLKKNPISDDEIILLSKFLKGNTETKILNLNLSGNDFTVTSLTDVLKTLSNLTKLSFLTINLNSCSYLTKKFKLNIQNEIKKYCPLHKSQLNIVV